MFNTKSYNLISNPITDAIGIRGTCEGSEMINKITQSMRALVDCFCRIIAILGLEIATMTLLNSQVIAPITAHNVDYVEKGGSSLDQKHQETLVPSQHTPCSLTMKCYGQNALYKNLLHLGVTP